MGRSGIFGPLLSTLVPWSDDQPSIFETNQLATSLARMIDFDELNDSACRFTVTAVDLQTGDDVVFDSRAIRIKPDHIRASAALLIAFPTVEIDGRWLVDGGLSANLPLDPVLADPPSRPTLCIAVDLLPLCGPLPTTIGETASRLQDLVFASQSRRTIARWQAEYAQRDDVRMSLLRLAYTNKAMRSRARRSTSLVRRSNYAGRPGNVREWTSCPNWLTVCWLLAQKAFASSSAASIPDLLNGSGSLPLNQMKRGISLRLGKGSRCRALGLIHQLERRSIARGANDRLG
jgi:hypothetical protein